MSFQREYSERYDRIKQPFTDFVFTYFTTMLYYEDYDNTSPEERLLLQQGMEAFGSIAPTYRIALLDKPTINLVFIQACDTGKFILCHLITLTFKFFYRQLYSQNQKKNPCHNIKVGTFAANKIIMLSS